MAAAEQAAEMVVATKVVARSSVRKAAAVGTMAEYWAEAAA